MFRKRQYILFLSISLVLLVSILSISYRFFPREYPSLWELLMDFQQKKTRKKGFFSRLFDPGRGQENFPPFREFFAQPNPLIKELQKSQLNKGQGNPKFHLDPEQLLLRENILAQLILHDRHGLNEKDAWSGIKRIKASGRFREYEEQRFLCEVLWMNYQEERSNFAILRKLLPITFQLVKKQEAYFEDFYNAGIAALLGGKIKNAIKYLDLANENWPASGRASGNVYFALMVAHAVDQNSSKTLNMLDGFKEHYPDWLHAETYIPDINELKKVYPRSQLLDVIHGRLVQNIYDFATASSAYKSVLQARNLDILTRTMVSTWLEEIEKEIQ